jgi:hypothetical protein
MVAGLVTALDDLAICYSLGARVIAAVTQWPWKSVVPSVGKESGRRD